MAILRNLIEEPNFAEPGVVSAAAMVAEGATYGEDPWRQVLWAEFNGARLEIDRRRAIAEGPGWLHLQVEQWIRGLVEESAEDTERRHRYAKWRRAWQKH